MKIYLSVILTLICAGYSYAQPGKKAPDVAAPTPAEVSNLPAADRDRAVELYTQEDYRSAIPLFDKVLTTDKSDLSSWLYFAMSLYKTGDTKDAADAFQHAVVLRNAIMKANIKNAPDDSHGFKITQKPRAHYTDDPKANVSGVVYLAVEFLATRKIGMIIPLKTLPGGLTRSAYEAAKEIKFDPFMKDIKPLTTVKIMEYSFTIY